MKPLDGRGHRNEGGPVRMGKGLGRGNGRSGWAIDDS